MDNFSNQREMIEKKILSPTFLAVDFFCGAGGTTRGLIDAGGYVIAGIDKDERCRQTYTTNNPNSSIDFAHPRFLAYDIFPSEESYPGGQQEDLLLELDLLLTNYKKAHRKLPLLFAVCAPCQPFTTLSRKELSEKRQRGREKDRNLLIEAAAYIDRFKPDMVLSENVSGIKDAKYGGVWDNFKKQLEKLGYATGSKVVCTSNFGIPQFRKRSILLAVRREMLREERFSDKQQSEILIPDSDPQESVVSVAQAIGHLPPLAAGETHPHIPNHRARSLSDLNLKRLSSAKPGESNSYMANTKYGDLTLDCHRKVNARLNTCCFSDVYTRMRPDRPSPTITTKCHSISNGRFGHFDVRQVRGISLREAAILQSFPDDYIFYPTNKTEPIARMIGNAVPPKLAQYFAQYLASAIKPH